MSLTLATAAVCVVPVLPWLALLLCVSCSCQLVPLESSKLKGLVNTRVGVMQEIGWDPEWEVSGQGLARTGGDSGGGDF